MTTTQTLPKKTIMTSSRIYAYLRASTTEQDASRAKESLEKFASEHGYTIDAEFIENESGRA